jgi:SAM-dependent methyltransferase
MSLFSRIWTALQTSLKGSGIPANPIQKPNAIPDPSNNKQSDPPAYEARLAYEEAVFENCLEIHQLPAIFHYWSNRYVRPKLEAFGFSNPGDFFRAQIEEKCRSSVQRVRAVSLGAGNCDMEIDLAATLRDRSISNFEIECLDLNQAMLDRGFEDAKRRNLLSYVTFSKGDFNEWHPHECFDIIIAHQSLHHVLNLEGLFTSIENGLKDDGIFLTSDMIGRNGHQRWPEALEIVHEFWKELPESYRFNQKLKRHEELYENWDCSTQGFEGIRAQDILPLLVDRFHFHLFVVFGNVIDPFVDRCFGHNFNAEGEWDRNFIDRVHARDEAEMLSGRIKPTHMLAVMGKHPAAALKFHPPLSPEFCIRLP